MVRAMAPFGRKKRAEPTVEQVDDAVPDEVQQASSEPIGMADYRGALLAVIEPLPPIGLNVLDALGRRLCEDIEIGRAHV